MERGNVYMGRILRVDLNEGSCDADELPEGLIEEHVGGAAINLALYERFKDRDPVVVGTGLLTGTLAPASCAGTLTGRSPVTGRVCHVPLLWQTAVELKYSGFDFIVILGESPKPVRLWLHDELAELAPAGDVWGKDVWETVDKLRFEHGDDYVQLLTIGPAGEKGSLLGQVSESYWGSRDIFGLGALLGRKRLKAVAMRGLGSLEVSDGFFEACVALKDAIASGRIAGKQGLLSILQATGAAPEGLQAVEARVHRNAASLSCVYPYNTFAMIEQDPKLLKETPHPEPGLLMTDPAGVASLLFLKEGLPAVLRRINRLGLEPTACGAALARRGVTSAAEAESALAAFAAEGFSLEADGVESVYGAAPWPFSASPEARLLQAASIFSHSLPPQPVFGSWEEFGAPAGAEGRARWWLERQACCLILGICPLSALLSPELSLEQMAGLAAKASQWEALTPDLLREKARELVRQSAALAEPRGSLPSAWQGADLETSLKAIVQGP
ncbi:MAG: aldehyde ferredoxin oxidoreductase N-terminal domain-containing protein [bacterium]